MPEEPFTPPPIPAHLFDFPTSGGLVISFITLQHTNGKAALGLVDPLRLELCLREKRCGVCGAVIADRMVFLMRRVDLDRNCSTEPPLCPPCAAYAQRACPMISGHMAHYQRSVSSFVTRRCGDPACWCSLWAPPDESSARLGAPAEQWYALWTQEYVLIRDDAGRLAAGLAARNVLRIREIRQCPAAPTRDQPS
jgi:hypothetical protein